MIAFLGQLAEYRHLNRVASHVPKPPESTRKVVRWLALDGPLENLARPPELSGPLLAFMCLVTSAVF